VISYNNDLRNDTAGLGGTVNTYMRIAFSLINSLFFYILSGYNLCVLKEFVTDINIRICLSE
jgi:hypothetical protein